MLPISGRASIIVFTIFLNPRMEEVNRKARKAERIRTIPSDVRITTKSDGWYSRLGNYSTLSKVLLRLQV